MLGGGGHHQKAELGRGIHSLKRSSRFGWFSKKKPQLNRIGMPVREEDIDAQDYISSKPPPPGFQDWLMFAEQNQCHLGPYDRILKDLEVMLQRSILCRIGRSCIYRPRGACC